VQTYKLYTNIYNTIEFIYYKLAGNHLHKSYLKHYKKQLSLYKLILILRKLLLTLLKG